MVIDWTRAWAAWSFFILFPSLCQLLNPLELDRLSLEVPGPAPSPSSPARWPRCLWRSRTRHRRAWRPCPCPWRSSFKAPPRQRGARRASLRSDRSAMLRHSSSSADLGGSDLFWPSGRTDVIKRSGQFGERGFLNAKYSRSRRPSLMSIVVFLWRPKARSAQSSLRCRKGEVKERSSDWGEDSLKVDPAGLANLVLPSFKRRLGLKGTYILGVCLGMVACGLLVLGSYLLEFSVLAPVGGLAPMRCSHVHLDLEHFKSFWVALTQNDIGIVSWWVCGAKASSEGDSGLSMPGSDTAIVF